MVALLGRVSLVGHWSRLLASGRIRDGDQIWRRWLAASGICGWVSVDKPSLVHRYPWPELFSVAAPTFAQRPAMTLYG